jgi:regulator of RNase E activity RraA
MTDSDPDSASDGTLPTTELCDRYAALYPGAATDVMDELGLADQTLDNAIGPVAPEMSVAGVAFPVVGRPNRSVDEEENVRNILRMLGEAPADSVLVYDTNDPQFSHIGELSVEALLARGCRGAVLDGGARDVGHILDSGFPTFTRHETPADAVPRWELLDWDVPAVVGGVRVEPGDVVLGDVDGVVVVPREHAVEVLERAEALVETEDEVRAAVREGTAPLDAYERFGRF